MATSTPSIGMEEIEEEVVGISRSSWNNSSFYKPRLRDNWPRPSLADRPIHLWNVDWWHKLRNVGHGDKDDNMKIDLNIKQNRKEHRTHYYEVKNLIVRRGQPFSIEVKISGIDFDPVMDQLILILTAGTQPLTKNGTMVNVVVHKDRLDISKDPNSWKAFIASSNKKEVQISVYPSATALVTPMKLMVKLLTKDDNLKAQQYITSINEDIFVLFNPWCQEDAVYLANESERQEYVLNDTGRIWVGDHDSMSSRPWRYGQIYKPSHKFHKGLITKKIGHIKWSPSGTKSFDKECLDAAFCLLDRSKLNKQGHGNVIQVCRAFTSHLNSKDNDGVLVGNWSGNYAGGVNPSVWNGSAAILEQYMQTKRPVKFGQCWVFSGLMTTVCRALGIPCRSTTTFLSGIDRDLSMTIDSFVNENLDPIHGMDDSNWNFHVWNDAWFVRPDLPSGYDGWQAIDSCPQDSMVSDGLHCCGPAPLQAVKEGNLYLGFDAQFVFAEVNGDQITWMVKRSGEVLPMQSFSKFNYIGKAISTKAVGSNARQDITHLYKHSEGSKEEREAVKRASHFSSKKKELLKFYDLDMATDVEFTYEGITNSQGDIVVTLGLRNTANEHRTVDAKLRIAASYYTGVTGEEVAVTSRVMELMPQSSKSIRWTVPVEMYLNTIDEDAILKAWVTGRVQRTDQLFFHTALFNIDKPDLHIQLSSSTVKVGEVVNVTVSFTNPLPTKLTNGVLSIDGLSTNKNIRVPLHRSLAQGETIKESVAIRPSYTGKTEIIASLNFRQLVGICGAEEITILD